MIRYRLPHEDLPGYYICKWCGATDEAIEDGRKPRYCAKNRKFKAPGYLNAESLEQICIEISKRTVGGLAINVTHMLVDVLALAEDPGVGFYGLAFPDILAHARAYEAAARDGMAMYNTAHPQHVIEGKDIWSVEMQPPQEMPIPDRFQDPSSWYIKDEDQAKVQTATQAHREQMASRILSKGFAMAGKPPLSAEEHCRYLCAWKGGGPCLATDCPRREKHENGDGV